jgi:hypothetical protein
MPGSSARHETAAARHEKTAVTHDRSAAFWEEQGDAARVDLHRDAAALERASAALERRWAQIIAAEGEGSAAPDGEQRLEGDASVEDREADAREDVAARRDQLAGQSEGDC